MFRLFKFASVALTIVCLWITGCHKTEVPVTDVTQLETLISQKNVTVFDANGEDTRLEYGVIPGAVMLSSYDEYDVPSTLPADKAAKLVFYCGSTQCSAAPKAAARAIQAGYTNVSHLKVGIKGWLEAGKAVDKRS